MYLLTIEGEHVAVDEFLRRFDRELIKVRRTVTGDNTSSIEAAVLENPGLAAHTILEAMYADGITPPTERDVAGGVREALTLFEIPYRPRPDDMGADSEWRADALDAVRRELEDAGLGLRVLHVEDTTDMGMLGTADLEIPIIGLTDVGFVAVAIDDPHHEEAGGVVRLDQDGTLRIRPP